MDPQPHSNWARITATCLGAAGAVVVVAVLAAGVPMLWPARSSQAVQVSEPAPAISGRSLGEVSAAREGEDPQFVRMRRQMVDLDLRGRDITDPKVLSAMGRVPRQEFVPAGLRSRAYADHPLPIGHDQTISQPYIVALMTQLAQPKAESRALDIGTGSGYQAAVLAEICREVYSIEILKPLADEARTRLESLGYRNVTVRHGDGYRGWPEKAPFDVIIVAAAPDHVPQPLVDQLAKGGKMVIPVGRSYQQLMVIERDREGVVHQKPGLPVMFVPMTGEAERRSP